MIIFTLICRSLFLLIAAEPAIIIFHKFLRHIRTSKNKDKDYYKLTFIYILSLILVFAIYTFSVAVVSQKEIDFGF